MATGTVKWFSGSKGYGFINPDDPNLPGLQEGRDLFVHVSGVVGGVLVDGHRVEFETRESPKGLVAVNVRPEGTASPKGRLEVRDYFGQPQVLLNAAGLTVETEWIHSESDINSEWPAHIQTSVRELLREWRASLEQARTEKEALKKRVSVRNCGEFEVEIVPQEYDPRCHKLLVAGVHVASASPAKADEVEAGLRELFTEGRNVTFSTVLRNYKVVGWVTVNEVCNLVDEDGSGVKRRLVVGVARKEGAPGQFEEIWFLPKSDRWGVEPVFYEYRLSIEGKLVSPAKVSGGEPAQIYIHVGG